MQIGDIRIKEPLFDYAPTSRALIQLLSDEDSLYADSTYPKPKDATPPASTLDFN
jgi:hypothetical protein